MVDVEAAVDFIGAIQARIYKALVSQSEENNCYALNIKAELEEILAYCGWRASGFLQSEEFINTVNSLNVLAQMCMDITPRELRAEIGRQSANNHTFAASTNKTVEEMAGTFSNLLADQVVTLMRENTRHNLLLKSVIYSTGSIQIRNALSLPSYGSSETLKKNCGLFSLSQYGLNKFFSSKQTLSFSTSPEEYDYFLSQPIGHWSDVSWLEKGQTEVSKREQKMEVSAWVIQRFFSSHQFQNKNPIDANTDRPMLGS